MESIEVARRFARSLDNEDYSSAAECLAITCEYHVAGKVHAGPEAILMSYRKSGDWAARTLDGVRYESIVRPGEDSAVVVEFVDYLEHGGKTHIHPCEQHLRFNEGGLISSIEHIDLPGEQEALTAFFALVGLPPFTP